MNTEEELKEAKKTLKEEEYKLENENLNETQKQQLNIGAVSGSLPSDEEIRGGADEWVFDINGMKWSNNDDTAGDNYGSFIAGAKWVLSRICNDR